MDRIELCQWLRDNSSGIYRPAAEAALEIEELVRRVEEVEADNARLRQQIQALQTGPGTAPASQAPVKAARPWPGNANDVAISGAELQKMGAFTVLLASCGNPDFGQDPYRPLSGARSEWVPVNSLAQAALVSRAYIEEEGLGGGNWAGGEVRNAHGDMVARVSYNGRVWAARAEPNEDQRDPVQRSRMR